MYDTTIIYDTIIKYDSGCIFWLLVTSIYEYYNYSLERAAVVKAAGLDKHNGTEENYF